MMDYPMVRIDWADACLPSRGWMTAAEIEPAFSLITSVGFLLRETEEFVTIASSFTQESSDEPQFCEIMHVPVGSIHSIKRLRTRGDLPPAQISLTADA